MRLYMPSNDTSARDRLVLAAADMLRRRGLHATSIRDVAKHAHAPLGSTYHYFPDGKSQMISEAVAMATGYISEQLRKALERGVVEGVRQFFSVWRDIVAASDYQAGCPVLAIAVEATDSETDRKALEAANAAFTEWRLLLAEAISEHGVGPTEATQTADFVIAACEGAIALSRASRSVQAIDNVSSQMQRFLTTLPMES